MGRKNIFFIHVNILTVNKNYWLNAFLDFLFPPLCLGCGEFNTSRTDICNKCLETINTFEYPFCLNCQVQITSGTVCPQCGDSALFLFAWGNYIDPLKQVIIQYKFKDITSPALIIARAIYEQFGKSIKSLGADILIPIPLHPSREYYRGYNQAALFAARLSELLAVPVNNDLLYRVEKRKPQARLNEFQRYRNIRGVFKTDKVVDKTNKPRILLVDDVVTSGATVFEARKTLESAGYKVLGVIAMAHGL